MSFGEYLSSSHYKILLVAVVTSDHCCLMRFCFVDKILLLDQYLACGPLVFKFLVPKSIAIFPKAIHVTELGPDTTSNRIKLCLFVY